MLASGGAELMSLGAVLPFLAVLTAPERLWEQPLVQELALKMGFTSESQLLIPVTLTFVFAVVLAALIRLSNLWVNRRMAAAVGSDLSCEAYRRTLYQPFSVHVQRNSAEVITGATTQIGLTVDALNRFLQLITSSVVAVSILTGLLVIDAPVALAAAVLFGTVYGALAISARRELRINGKKIVAASTQQLKALQEGLGAIRDVLLDGIQPTYLQIYRQADRPQRQLQAHNGFLSSYPRYVLEAMGLVAIALLGCGLLLQQGSGSDVIPLLGTLALGAQRLLPALQQIYSGWATLKGYSAAMLGVIEMLNQPLPPRVARAISAKLFSKITLKGVHFRYGPEQPEVLRELDLEICCGERIGLIGGTGSGKSSTVDLLMGLLAPTAGRFLVDGENLHDPEQREHLESWRAGIAHVPQNIFLSDTSIAENIAFGVPPQQIDLDRVKQVAEQAEIASFIEASLGGYQSFVGERGIRLSGGQRQRIGIARALYKRARVLVLDEATSALDEQTESKVMNSLNALSKDLTVILVAHRLSTLSFCDRLIKLKGGSVEQILTYNDLQNLSPDNINQ